MAERSFNGLPDQSDKMSDAAMTSRWYCVVGVERVGT